MAKRSFLAVYDYGMGGIWVVILAREAAEIVAKYPELKVFETHPDFISQEDYDDIAAKMTFDIDDAPSGWLRGLVDERK